jgi:hypothetical protein
MLTSDWATISPKFAAIMLVTLSTFADVQLTLILRVKEILGTGRLLLEGRDKKTIKEHVENCAPCHNPNIDLWHNPALAAGDVDQACQVCHKTSGARHMLLCDNCAEGWHMYCLTPALTRIPRGDWFCPRCREPDAA